MRKFAFQQIAFWGLQAIICASILAAYRVDTGAYMAANQDKQARLAELGSPKMILVGGSSTAFGFDSAKLEQAFGMPVVNMGIQASLGLDYIVNEVADSIGEGDIVIASIEYPLYTGRSESALTIFQMLEQQPSEVTKLTYDPHMLKVLLDEAHLYLRHVLRGFIAQYVPARRMQGELRRDWHNEFGDVAKHRTLPPRSFNPERPRYFTVDPHALEALQRLAEVCRRRGAKMFIFHPAVARPHESAARDAYQPIYDAIAESTDIVQLNEPREMVYDLKLFFDSSYHVTAEGVQKRTGLLIERLEPRL